MPFDSSPAQRFARGCGLAAVCAIAAAFGTAAFGAAVGGLNAVLEAQPRLFAVGVFAALLTVFVRVAFRGRG